MRVTTLTSFSDDVVFRVARQKLKTSLPYIREGSDTDYVLSDMGLLGEIYSVFGLVYSITLATLKHDDLSRSDKAFIAATAAFLVLSIGNFLNKVRVIPSGYKCIFVGKSLLRGLLGPLLSLLYYPILFYSKDRVKWALTFSNEAHDGVERTRQLKIFELVELGSRARRHLTTHRLSSYGKEKKWGYDRLVGEIWVTVRFEAQFNVDTSRKLETSDLGMKLLLQYQRDTGSQQAQEPILEVNTGTVNVPKAKQESVKVSCLECICVDLHGSGTNPANPGTPGTPSGTLPATPATSQNPATPTSQNPPPPPTSPTCQNPPEQYAVTITRRRALCRIERGECWLCPGLTWNLKCTAVRQWTLFQIHQYMLCLDVWGNHPKQGIWKPRQPHTCCSGDDTSCCNAFTRIKRALLSCLPGQGSTNPPENNQASRKIKFRYCYRHDELINAIDNNRRVTSRPNDSTWHTVV